jgi:hypothetical protein
LAETQQILNKALLDTSDSVAQRVKRLQALKALSTDFTIDEAHVQSLFMADITQSTVFGVPRVSVMDKTAIEVLVDYFAREDGLDFTWVFPVGFECNLTTFAWLAGK